VGHAPCLTSWLNMEGRWFFLVSSDLRLGVIPFTSTLSEGVNYGFSKLSETETIKREANRADLPEGNRIECFY
jgi:hypothetical protein